MELVIIVVVALAVIYGLYRFATKQEKSQEVAPYKLEAPTVEVKEEVKLEPVVVTAKPKQAKKTTKPTSTAKPKTPNKPKASKPKAPKAPKA